MQIYISRVREKQLRDYASSHNVSMSSVIDKSLEQYFVSNRTDKPIPRIEPIPMPDKTPQPSQSLLKKIITNKESIPFD